MVVQTWQGSRVKPWQPGEGIVLSTVLCAERLANIVPLEWEVKSIAYKTPIWKASNPWQYRQPRVVKRHKL